MGLQLERPITNYYLDPNCKTNVSAEAYRKTNRQRVYLAIKQHIIHPLWPIEAVIAFPKTS